MKKPELLSPAGNMEKLKMAIIYGADAVYLGGPDFGLRALAGNFTRDEMREAVGFAHGRQKKVYVTVNVFPRNDDLVSLPDYLKFLQSIEVDGILVADIGVFFAAKRIIPQMPVHISTQANATSVASVEAWRNLGAERVVLARELSMREIKEIRRSTDAELEMFVHGAMCISYSGRCLMSSFMAGRDANRGNCAQPCRWRYALTEEKRSGEYFPIEEDERGSYFFNSKDLCLMGNIADVIDTGVDSLKIEGRMKSVHYVASVTKAYREAIDSLLDDREHFAVKNEWLDELDKVSHRPYTTGFFYGRTTEDDQIYGTSSYTQTSDFVGLVLSYDENGFATVEQRNNMQSGQEIEVFQPTLATFRQKIYEMYDDEGRRIDAAPHPQQIVRMKMDKRVEPYSILRRDVPYGEG
ncbi:MAG: U32 family peptidase [Schwartzia sp.]|nr:U32 family peptidase [Schwartzia sp. (in: firmicutes)]